jgi:hypothetical protein
MQRIQVYLYPNRITLVSNLDEGSAHNVEWRIVYQRTVKIYKGINNIIELEVRNNDQKRIELGTSELKLVLMDQSQNLINTYTAQSLEDSTIVGLARITIPSADIAELDPQYLRFAVYQTNAIFENVLTYNDSQFGAIGTIQLLNGINTQTTITRKYDRWTQMTDYNNARFEERKIYKISEAIPTDGYRAIPITEMSFTLQANSFLGEFSLEGTNQEVIGNEAFINSKILYQAYIPGSPQTGPVIIPNIDVTDLTYIRLKYLAANTGSIDSITVTV